MTSPAAADRARTRDPVTPAAPAATAAPSSVDATVARASSAIGGSWGRHAAVARRAWWTPVRVLLALTCLSLLLGFAQKSPCESGEWTGYKQYTHMCYSDVVPLWSAERIDVAAVPYRDTAVEYPVLTGGFMWIAGDAARLLHQLDTSWSELVLYVAVTLLALAVCGLLTTVGTAQAAGRRPYDAAIFALSPLLVFHAFSNWDLFAMAFASGALWAWARRKPVLAGVLIGLGTAAKLYPVFLLVALAVLAYRTRRVASVVWATVAAVVAWLAVNVPVGLAYPHSWWAFYRFSEQRSTERSTLWAIGKTIATTGLDTSDTTYWVPPGAAVALALVAALLVVVWLALRAPVKPRLGQLAFLVVLAFLLTTKVWSPQYSLWLVPLLALARPRWRLSLIWQFVEALVWVMTLTLLLGESPGQEAHGVGYGWLVLVLLVRDALLLGIAALVVREMWRPELDVVRSSGLDDPAGGVFDGADDHVRPPVRVAPEAVRNAH